MAHTRKSLGWGSHSADPGSPDIFFTGRQRAIAFAIYLTIVAIGEFLSIYQGRLFAQLLDWRGAYLIPAVTTIVAIVIVRRSLPESRTADPRTLQAIFYAGWTILVLGLIYALFELILGHEWLVVVLVINGIMLATGLGLIFCWWRKEHRDSLHQKLS
jgi:predicted MFS family arabinose efflux permease